MTDFGTIIKDMSVCLVKRDLERMEHERRRAAIIEAAQYLRDGAPGRALEALDKAMETTTPKVSKKHEN